MRGGELRMGAQTHRKGSNVAQWRVTMKLNQSTDEQQLNPQAIFDFAHSLPGGGVAGSGDHEFEIGPREFTLTLDEVEADSAEEAKVAGGRCHQLFDRSFIAPRMDGRSAG